VHLPRAVGATVGMSLILGCGHPAPPPAPAPSVVSPTTPPGTTGAEISAQDLELRLSIVSDDSMAGREAGTIGDFKATTYIADEFRKLGLAPGGENGTYFQTVPLARVSLDERTTSIRVNGRELKLWTDVAPVEADSALSLTGVRAVYGGLATDSSTWISAQAAAGRIVVLGVPERVKGYVPISPLAANPRFHQSLAVVIPELALVDTALITASRQPTTQASTPTADVGPILMPASLQAAEAMVGAPLSTVKPGTLGPPMSGTIALTRAPVEAPARNVVAILRGGDPALRGQYVAIGAHNDHLGVDTQAFDHDSVRIANGMLRPLGADDPPRAPTAAQAAAIARARDSVSHVRPPRRDSIFNGADDDGSGTVALLEIAEAFAKAPTLPKRSILFVSHTGEEEGTLGSHYFMEHPTVPRDSIVAQVNLDMVGRSDSPQDSIRRGPYLQVIGSKRISTEFGTLVEQVNKDEHPSFRFDYSFDAPGHPEQYYCRSDHWEYARFGIPIVFFTTGGHRDYHQVTDESQYIDYIKLQRVTQLAYDITLRTANLDHRPKSDHPKTDPNAACVQ